MDMIMYYRYILVLFVQSATMPVVVKEQEGFAPLSLIFQNSILIPLRLETN
jgi:hypothetical protein